jgi:tetratricopeptide (TPR) repeat protein
MRNLLLILFLGCGVAVWAQSSNSSKSQDSSKSTPAQNPKLAPPRSDKVDASTLPDGGESSSKETRIDLSPPSDDAKAHPRSSEILVDEGSSGDANQAHPWDPHKAAKDVEVGDFYFKKKNYVAAESRYREALYYKDNDAIATYHLAECLEKMDRANEAREQYESYLKILPYGPEAENAKTAIGRLKAEAAKAAK